MKNGNLAAKRTYDREPYGYKSERAEMDAQTSAQRKAPRGNTAAAHTAQRQNEEYVRGTASSAPMRNMQSYNAQMKKEQARGVNVAVIVFYVIVIFVVAFFLIGREITIYQKNIEVNSLASELEALHNQNEHTMLEIEQSIDLAGVEKIAEEQLGMVHASKAQTTYMNVWQEDYVEKVADKSTDKKGRLNIFGIFSKN